MCILLYQAELYFQQCWPSYNYADLETPQIWVWNTHWSKQTFIQVQATSVICVNSSHHNDVILGAIASQITSLTIVYSTGYLRRRSKKTWKLRVTGLCAGNSLVTGEFPAQLASNEKNVSIWWGRNVKLKSDCCGRTRSTPWLVIHLV